MYLIVALQAELDDLLRYGARELFAEAADQEQQAQAAAQEQQSASAVPGVLLMLAEPKGSKPRLRLRQPANLRAAIVTCGCAVQAPQLQHLQPPHSQGQAGTSCSGSHLQAAGIPCKALRSLQSSLLDNSRLVRRLSSRPASQQARVMRSGPRLPSCSECGSRRLQQGVLEARQAPGSCMTMLPWTLCSTGAPAHVC